MDRIKIFSRFSYPQIEVGGDVENPGSYPYWAGITLRDVLGPAVPKGDPAHLKVEVFRLREPPTPEEEEEEVPLSVPTRAPLVEDPETFEKEREALKAERNLLEIEKRALEAEKRTLTAEQKLHATQQQLETLASGEDLSDEEGDLPEKEPVSTRFEPTELVYLYDLMVLGKNDVNYLLEPGMKLVVKPLEAVERVKTAAVLGRVKRPGVYPIDDGDRLSDLIDKAGGFTKRAYPPGIVFLRESVRAMQEERLKATMLAIEEGLIRQTTEAESRLTPDELRAIRTSISRQTQLLDNIRAKTELVLGRVAIRVPPEIEELRSANDDLVLEGGDEIFVPKKPDSTIILGELYNPVALAYRPGKSIDYYINQAGGLTKFSDTKEMFVIKADGTVVSRRQKSFVWTRSWDRKSKRFYFGKNFEDLPLDPGDTIVVPSKVKIPILWRPLIRDVVQIMFQAISTVAIIDRL
jgi:protein involved in polysaccharide export with SLBB domain